MMPLRNVLSQIELRASLAVMGIVQLVVPFLGETVTDTTHTRQAGKSEVITYMYIHAKRQHIHLPISSSIITLSQMIAKKNVTGNNSTVSTVQTKCPLATILPTLIEKKTT